MAMNKDVLGEALANRILSRVPIGITVPSGVKIDMKDFWTAIADEIIEHIKEYGEVEVTTQATGAVTGDTVETTGIGSGTMS